MFTSTLVVDSSPTLKTEKTKLYGSYEAKLVHAAKWMNEFSYISIYQSYSIII